MRFFLLLALLFSFFQRLYAAPGDPDDPYKVNYSPVIGVEQEYVASSARFRVELCVVTSLCVLGASYWGVSEAARLVAEENGWLPWIWNTFLFSAAAGVNYITNKIFFETSKISQGYETEKEAALVRYKKNLESIASSKNETDRDYFKLSYVQQSGSLGFLKIEFPNLKFTAPSGEEAFFWLGFYSDTLVYEVHSPTLPQHIYDYPEIRAAVEKYLFLETRKAGMVPRKFYGMNHQNIDTTVIRSNPLFLRNIFIDLVNFSEVLNLFYFDGFRGSQKNLVEQLRWGHISGAEEISFTREVQESLQSVLAELDKALEEDAKDEQNVKLLELKRLLEVAGMVRGSMINIQSSMGHNNPAGIDFDPHAMVVDQTRFEIRAIPTAKSPKMMTDFLRIFAYRFRYIKYLSDRGVRIGYFPTRMENFQQLVDMYFLYLKQAGLSYEDYKYLVPRMLQIVTPSRNLAQQFDVKAQSHNFDYVTFAQEIRMSLDPGQQDLPSITYPVMKSYQAHREVFNGGPGEKLPPYMNCVLHLNKVFR